MLLDRPWFKPAIAAVWIVSLAGCYYTLAAKFQFVAGCNTRLGQSQLTTAQIEQNEAQVKEFGSAARCRRGAARQGEALGGDDDQQLGL